MRSNKLIIRVKNMDSIVHVLLYSLMYAVNIALVISFIWVCYLYLVNAIWWFYPLMLIVSFFSATMFYCKYEVLREAYRAGLATDREIRLMRASAVIAGLMFLFVVGFMMLCLHNIIELY